MFELTSAADITNGLFEMIGAIVLWQNVKQIRKDKQVRGINPWTTAYFSTWGFWNLYYYPSLGQWWSFAGGLCIVSVNAIWLAYMFYYYYQEKGYFR